MHMLYLYSRFYHESEKETIVSSIIKIINYFLSETMSTGKGVGRKVLFCVGVFTIIDGKQSLNIKSIVLL